MKTLRFLGDCVYALIFGLLIFVLFLPAHVREWRLRRSLGANYEGQLAGEDES